MQHVKASGYDPTPADKPFWQNGQYYTLWLNVKTHILYKWSKLGWKVKEIQYGQKAQHQTQGTPET